MNSLQVVIALVAAASASPLYSNGQEGNYQLDNHYHDWHKPKYAPAHYNYEYGVHDPHTGDIKEARETGDGHGGVKGYYKLKEADGTIRIVHYTADKHEGFTAHVEKIGKSVHPVRSDNHHNKNKYQYVKHQTDTKLKSLYHHGLVEEMHYPGPPRHYHLNPYVYGYYQPKINHKFVVHHDEHHPKLHPALSSDHY